MRNGSATAAQFRRSIVTDGAIRQNRVANCFRKMAKIAELRCSRVETGAGLLRIAKIIAQPCRGFEKRCSVQKFHRREDNSGCDAFALLGTDARKPRLGIGEAAKAKLLAFANPFHAL